MPRRFRIHPAIGVARVGNSPNEFFIGPEHPGIPANWGNGAFDSFRDAQGRIKRQAARFRVFEYVDDGVSGLKPQEVVIGADIADVEWRVHVANRKGSFFTFNGQSGASDLFQTRSGRPGTAPEKDDDPPRSNLRNAGVPVDQRSTVLDIDPGEKLISKATAPGPIVLTNPNANIPFITDLGELRLDQDGNLLFLGGHGTSGSTATPPVEIDEYANNDTWFDDVSDGSVKARIRFADGTFADADAAWVLVGPPDFAPSVTNALSLYDLLTDIAVRKLPLSFGSMFASGELNDILAIKEAWMANGESALDGFKPSFMKHVYPILSRALDVRWIHEPFEKDKKTYHKQLLDWNTLAALDEGDPLGPDPAAFREYVFNRIRKPDAEKIDWLGMPRGLGDDYGSLYTVSPASTALVSFTRIQYAILEQWNKGHFIADWPGAEPNIPAAGPISPARLDRAALENCVGGPFFPGIEVSWLIREPALYAEPFRLNIPAVPEAEIQQPPLQIGALQFRSGFFSQQMAQPWQADFYDCHKEEQEAGDQKPYYYMWWTAQRPDDVFTAGSTKQVPWVRQLVPNGMSFDDFQGDNVRFKQMVENWHRLRFVVKANGRLEEEPE
jgi:hypothetical protein